MSRRADSNRLPLLQLRVIHQVLQAFAQDCKSRISSRFLCSGLLRVALYCVPGGVRVVSEAHDGTSPSSSRLRLGYRSLRVVLHEPLRHGDGSVGDLVASFLAATASSSALSFPLLCGPAVLECPLTFPHRTSWCRCVA